MTSRIHARYLVETGAGLDRAAATMAGEQSTGTFVALPGETPELHARNGGRVESVRELAADVPPSLSGPVGEGRIVRGEVELSFPLDNVGTSLPNLLAMVAGNLFELRELSGIRIVDLVLPPEFGAAHPGPAFGIPGTRDIAGVHGRPIVGTIVKPSVGLSPGETGALAGDLARAGLDFIKDDELQANGPHSPFEERLDAVLGELRRAADETGTMPIYAANVSDELDAMLRHVDLVAERGGNCVMVNVNAIGIVALRAVRQRSTLPIHAHRTGWGALTRSPALGFSFAVWQQLWRLAGADHLHVNGLRNKFWEPDDSVLASARAVLTPINGGPAAMPVFSSGQSAGQAADTYAALGTPDLLYLCGGGIMAHPDGIRAGAASIRQAWDAALAGLPIEFSAADHPELRRALEFFAPRPDPRSASSSALRM
jgi:ribulose-bisphosphate carboxylase large chain